MLAIIPAAGFGKRMAGLTRGRAKELLPIHGKPMIDYALEEAIGSGMSKLLIVISPRKEELKEHLTAEWSRRPSPLNFIYQNEPLGLADAIYRCRNYIENSMFALLLPDNIFIGNPPLKSLIDVAKKYKKSVTALIKVKESEASYFGNCGGVDASPYKDKRKVEVSQYNGEIFEIKKIEDKKPGSFSTQGKSDVLRSFPRHIFTRELFEYIDRLRGKTEGEFDDVPVLQEMVREGKILGLLVRGKAFDVGSPRGYRHVESANDWKH